MQNYGPLGLGLLNPLNWFASLKRDKYTILNLNQYSVGHKGLMYLDTERPYIIYNLIPQFKTAIDRRASMEASVVIRLLDEETGEDVGSDELYMRLEKPNPLQRQNAWLEEGTRHRLIYGHNFVYKNVPSKLSDAPKTLFNVSPQFLTPKLTGKIFDQVEIEGIYEYFRYLDSSGFEKKYDTSTILYLKNPDVNNPALGISPVIGLKFPLSNTDLAYKYRNVIAGAQGGLGMLVNKSKDAMGATPVDAEEKRKIEEARRASYGVEDGQMKFHISTGDMDWKPMTYETSKLKLFEEVDENFKTILDAFGLNRNLYGVSTFENLKSGIVLTYQDTIMPATDLRLQELQPFLGEDLCRPTKGKKAKLCGSFEHIPILKSDRQKSVTTFKDMVDTLKSCVEANFITQDQANIIINNELKNISASGY